MKCTIKKDTDWREAYRQVLSEADPEKSQMNIEAALDTVKRCICILWDVQPPDLGELNQLAYASHILGLLKQHGWGAQAKSQPPIGSAFNLEEKPC